MISRKMILFKRGTVTASGEFPFKTPEMEEIKKKMLEGKINTYFKEKTLKSQPFIKNPDETVGQLLERNKAKIIEVKRYFI